MFLFRLKFIFYWAHIGEDVKQLNASQLWHATVRTMDTRAYKSKTGPGEILFIGLALREILLISLWTHNSRLITDDNSLERVTGFCREDEKR